MPPTSTDAPAGDATTTASGSYEVHTPVYEGPFDLLLHLILRDQVDLYEITLTEIVDAYLFELERMETLDLDIATELQAESLFTTLLAEQESQKLDAALQLNERFFSEETEKLEAWAEDRRIALDIRIKQLDQEIK